MLQVERFFRQSRMLLRHCCWCGRGFSLHSNEMHGRTWSRALFIVGKHTNRRTDREILDGAVWLGRGVYCFNTAGRAHLTAAICDTVGMMMIRRTPCNTIKRTGRCCLACNEPVYCRWWWWRHSDACLDVTRRAWHFVVMETAAAVVWQTMFDVAVWTSKRSFSCYVGGSGFVRCESEKRRRSAYGNRCGRTWGGRLLLLKVWNVS